MRRTTPLLLLALSLLLAWPASAQMARLQVIHNAADPAAAVVDIYVNGELDVDDFAFRTASPYVDVPAEVELIIGIAPGDSDGPEDVIAEFPATLDDGETYSVIANGVLDPSGFAPNPDGRDIGFTLWVKPMAREASGDPDAVDFFAVHGATDAPTVDVVLGNPALLPLAVDDAAYGDITGYISAPAERYRVGVTPGDDRTTILARFRAMLDGAGGASAVILASGFLDPSANQGGAAFTLIAVLPDGTVLDLGASAGASPSAGRTFGASAYPNPFNPTTTLSFDLPEAAEVSVEIFSLLGQRVMALPAQTYGAGTAAVQLDGSRLASGTYLYRIAARTAQDVLMTSGRLTLLK